jgi:hypothetical protein
MDKWMNYLINLICEWINLGGQEWMNKWLNEWTNEWKNRAWDWLIRPGWQVKFSTILWYEIFYKYQLGGENQELSANADIF